MGGSGCPWSASTLRATTVPSSTSAGKPRTVWPPTRPSKVSGTVPTVHVVSPVRSNSAPAVAIRARTVGAALSRSAAMSLPVATTRPRSPSMAKVMRRWSGTLVRSHSDGSMRIPVREWSARAELLAQGAARGGVGVLQSSHRMVGRRDEVTSGDLGERLEEGHGEVVAQTRHLPVEAVSSTRLRTAAGMCTVTPSASAPGRTDRSP